MVSFDCVSRFECFRRAGHGRQEAARRPVGDEAGDDGGRDERDAQLRSAAGRPATAGGAEASRRDGQEPGASQERG